MQAPFANEAVNKMVVDLLTTPYEKTLNTCSVETLITIVGHLQAYGKAQRVELWGKLQTLLITSLKNREESVSNESIMLLVNALCA